MAPADQSDLIPEGRPAPVEVTVSDGVHVARIDDGKANALTPAVFEALTAALDDVENDDEAGALVLTGRPGMFSGGFDLTIMKRGDRSTLELVTDGGEFVRRCYASPTPVVAACTGHAVAAGCFLLLGSHHRVGAAGDVRFQLIETQIGMPLPAWAVEICRERLVATQLQRATVESRTYDPEGACDAGFLDRVVPAGSELDEALVEARRLADLPASAYGANSRHLRLPGAARMEAALDHDREVAAGL